MTGMRRRRFARVAAGALCWLIAIGHSSAQNNPPTGQIKGHVVDLIGAAIPGAKVFLHREHPNGNEITLVAHTDIHGDFVLVLPEGGYDVLVTSSGFISAVATVAVWRGKAKKLDWKLSVLGCDFPGMNCDTFQ